MPAQRVLKLWRLMQNNSQAQRLSRPQVQDGLHKVVPAGSSLFSRSRSLLRTVVALMRAGVLRDLDSVLSSWPAGDGVAGCAAPWLFTAVVSLQARHMQPSTLDCADSYLLQDSSKLQLHASLH